MKGTGRTERLPSRSQPHLQALSVLVASPVLQAVVETLKMLLVALSVVTDAGGPEPQRALLDLLLPLLIEAAAPESVPASLALTDVALKLISHLASGLAAGSAAGFRSAVAALQPSAKQRLQVLREFCVLLIQAAEKFE